MALPSGVDGVSGGAVALEEAFEPAAKKLTDLWMEISDVQCALSRAAQTGESVLADMKRLDDLIFSSVETMDELFTSVREDLKRRKASASAPPACLPVNALDAYLAGANELPPPTASRGVQTEPLAPPVVPTPVVTKVSLSSIETFDLLRGLTSKAKPKLEVKTEAPVPSQSKKRTRSPASSDSGETKKKDSKKSGAMGTTGPRPIAVRGDRMRLSQREYQVEFEGLDSLVWVVCRRATPDVKALIHKYNDTRKAERRRQQRQAALQGDVTDEDGENVDDGIYIVEKIVDHRIRFGKKQYLVKWDGYDTDENTWEPATKLRSEVRHIVDEYERERAKAASLQSKGDSNTQSSVNISSSSSHTSSVIVGRQTTVKKGYGRPSDPSVLRKSVLKKTAPPAGVTNMLKASGKIPKIQFASSFNIDDDEEDSDIARLAASEEDDDSLDEYFDVPEKPSGKAVRFQELSPQVE